MWCDGRGSRTQSRAGGREDWRRDRRVALPRNHDAGKAYRTREEGFCRRRRRTEKTVQRDLTSGSVRPRLPCAIEEAIVHDPQPNPLGFVPIPLLSIPWALCSTSLPRHNAPLYFVLGVLPLVNWFATVFIVGAPDLVLRAKIDRLISDLRQVSQTQKPV